MKKLMSTALCVLAAFSLAAANYTMKFTTNKKGAVYRCGEKIVMTGQLLLNGKPAIGCVMEYKLFLNGKATKRGSVKVSARPLTIETSMDRPGWTHFYCTFKDKNNKPLTFKKMYRGKLTTYQLGGGIGAMTEPHKIDTVMPEPEDFDAFWGRIRKETLAYPMKVLEKVDVTPKDKKDKFTVFDMKVSCAGGKPVSGYLIIPKGAKAKSMPLYVSYHGAGFRSSRMLFEYAEMGMIVFDVNAHGILNGQNQAYYDRVRVETNKQCGGRYNHSHKNDRDKYFYKTVYMRVLRSLQYAKSLPEWDGKHLIVSGGSQGGAQAIFACAMDHDVTLVRALVPALSDHAGSLAGRRQGWPRLYKAVNGKPEDPAVARAVAYYDNVYFARRIKCPIYICTGFIDTVCSPTSVFAVYNNLPKSTFKSMCITPDAPHTASDRYFPNALKEYLAKIRK